MVHPAPLLRLLYLSQFPPSPPSFGAQRRMQGVMAALARHHEVTAVSLLTPDHDRETVERAMGGYCREVVLVPMAQIDGRRKRLLQLRSLVSPRSFERQAFDVPALRTALRSLLARGTFDAATVEFPFLADQPLDAASPGSLPPLRILDEHNIEFDLARQQARAEHGLLRRLHHTANWPKLRREELTAFRTFDGVTFCSEADQQRAEAEVPGLRSAVVPNAVDVDHFQPRPGDPPPDPDTVLFFGALNYFPNLDGLGAFFRDIWPLLSRSHPRARIKIVGQQPPPDILALRGPRIEVTGRVDDLRPHLASAAVTIAPLRIGGGTRFKILEALAMARPVVSTTLGAEGLEAEKGTHLLLADSPADFAAAVGRVLDTPALGQRLGAQGRKLVEERYSWTFAAQRVERFVESLLQQRTARPARTG